MIGRAVRVAVAWAAALLATGIAACHRTPPGPVCETVAGVVAGADALRGRPLLIVGRVRSATLMRRDCEYVFDLEGGGAALPVHFGHCGLPDGVREGAPVGVFGTLGDAGAIEATSFLSQAPSFAPAPPLRCEALASVAPAPQ